MRLYLLISIFLAVTMSAAQCATDPRLAQKVTYQGGYKRLHAVAEELTKQTGVTIRCGSSSQDWRVRDIPLVVCVKDMPLSKLLQTLADCAHVTLAAEKIANAKDDKTAYRLYRTKKQQDDIPSGLDAQAEANLKLSAWAWDTLVAYAKMPYASADIPTTKPNGWDTVDAALIRSVAEVLADIGPENRAKALAGEQVSVKIGANPKSAGLRSVYEYALGHDSDFSMGTRLTPTQSEREQSMLSLRITRRDEPDPGGGFCFYVCGVPVKLAGRDDGFRYMDTWNTGPVMLAKVLASTKKLKFAPPPDSGAASDEPYVRPNFKSLSTDEDWKLPVLQKSMTLKLPEKPTEQLRVSSVLVAFAKASGMNVVCEDFFSHRVGMWSTANVTPDAKTSPEQVLRALSLKTRRIHWYLSEESNLLVGWSYQWRRRHQALVSESFIARLHDKCAADGAELEDIIPLVDMTREQVSEWFSDTADFYGLTLDAYGYSAGMWRLYGSLSAEDRALARSNAGLPLAKLDAKWLVQFFAQAKQEADAHVIATSAPRNDPAQAKSDRYMTDPKLIGSLVMHVRSQPSAEMCTIRLIDAKGEVTRDQYRPGPNVPEKHSYEISFENEKEPDPRLPGGTWYDVGFPLYTPEREAELRAQAEKKVTR